MNEFCVRSITGILMLLVMLASFLYAPFIFSCLFLLILFLIISTELPRLFVHNPLLWLMLPLYPSMPIGLIIWLNHTPDRFLLLFTFASVFLADTSAYCFGKLWGKHKIAPRISPGKSWEGLLGAWIVCFCAVLLFQVYEYNQIHFLSACLQVSVVVVIGTCGDFFESYLKRKAGVKDSGILLPGHGGLLDRFDALLFVVPATILFKNYFFFLRCF